MKVSLVIMAAGLGSRYGGSKQVDGIGPHNEILMEYSIHDALRAGFSKVVFIIKPEMEEMMHRLCGDYLAKKTALDGSPVEVAYAFQDFSSVPDFYHIPAERTKPFGTVHALLCAADAVHEPFCVINADDYYGIDAYRTIYQELVRLPEAGKATMVGYLLKNTASLHGTVSRGVCRVEAEPELDAAALAEFCGRSPLPVTERARETPLLVTRLPLPAGEWRDGRGNRFRVERRGGLSQLFAGEETGSELPAGVRPFRLNGWK